MTMLAADLVGRDRDVDGLVGDYVTAGCAGLLLSGAPGVGTSSVARAVAARIGASVVDDVGGLAPDAAFELERRVVVGNDPIVVVTRAAPGPRPQIVGTLLRTGRFLARTVAPLGPAACAELLTRLAGPVDIVTATTVARLTLGRPGRVRLVAPAVARSPRASHGAIRRVITADEGRRRWEPISAPGRFAVQLVAAAGHPLALADVLDDVDAGGLAEAVDAELLVLHPGDDEAIAPDARVHRPAMVSLAPWVDLTQFGSWPAIAPERRSGVAARCRADAAVVVDEFVAAVNGGERTRAVELRTELDLDLVPLLDVSLGVSCWGAEARRRFSEGQAAGAAELWAAVVDLAGDPATDSAAPCRDVNAPEVAGAIAGLGACAAVADDAHAAVAWASEYDTGHAADVHAESMRSIVDAVSGAAGAAVARLRQAVDCPRAGGGWPALGCAFGLAVLGAPLAGEELRDVVGDGLASSPVAQAVARLSEAVEVGDAEAIETAADGLDGVGVHGWAMSAWALAAATAAEAGGEAVRRRCARRVLASERRGLAAFVVDRSALATPVCSPRELEVAALAAAGTTRAAIGRELFISQKTVDRHLTAVFAKLGLTSRDELPSALAALGGEVS